MSDFVRLASAFDVLVQDLEMKLASVMKSLSMQQEDLRELRSFLDRPGAVGTAGYTDGLRRVVRMEISLKRLEGELSALRAALGRAKGKRDKCLSRARQDAAAERRQRDERELVELVSLTTGTSLGQPAGD